MLERSKYQLQTTINSLKQHEAVRNSDREKTLDKAIFLRIPKSEGDKTKNIVN
jgi:hypothetical protein